jgi:predicted metal-binding transcription factor (methanogenesis marker protein 9)
MLKFTDPFEDIRSPVIDIDRVSLAWYIIKVLYCPVFAKFNVQKYKKYEYFRQNCSVYTCKIPYA